MGAAGSCLRGHGVHGHFGGACEFGKTEVQNLDWATLGEKDVRGLDVAVDDALSVSGVEGVGELDADVEHAIEG